MPFLNIYSNIGLSRRKKSSRSFIANFNDNWRVRYDLHKTSFNHENRSKNYAIFELEGDNRYLTSFKITNNDNIDGVEETDGLDVIGDSISVDFPNGMLVLQDGFNFENGQQIPQNFKYVRLEKVLNILKR